MTRGGVRGLVRKKGKERKKEVRERVELTRERGVVPGKRKGRRNLGKGNGAW